MVPIHFHNALKEEFHRFAVLMAKKIAVMYLRNISWSWISQKYAWLAEIRTPRIHM